MRQSEQHSSKDKRVEDSSPLENLQTLGLVLKYTGAGDFLFAQSVCKIWSSLYTQQFPRPTTSRAAAVFSLSRLRLSAASGLRIDLSIAKTLGCFADKATILWAVGNGVPRSVCICGGAATMCRLELLRWLHYEQQMPWECRFIVRWAAENGSLALLQFMLGQADAQEISPVLDGGSCQRGGMSVL